MRLDKDWLYNYYKLTKQISSLNLNTKDDAHKIEEVDQSEGTDQTSNTSSNIEEENQSDADSSEISE